MEKECFACDHERKVLIVVRKKPFCKWCVADILKEHIGDDGEWLN
jgi:hypothetical protein